MSDNNAGNIHRLLVPEEALRIDGEHLIFAITREGRFHAANAVTCTVLGYTERELRGMDVASIMRPGEELRKTEPEIADIHKRVIDNPGERLAWRSFAKTRWGHVVWLEAEVRWEPGSRIWVEDAIVVMIEPSAFPGERAVIVMEQEQAVTPATRSRTPRNRQAALPGIPDHRTESFGRKTQVLEALFADSANCPTLSEVSDAWSVALIKGRSVTTVRDYLRERGFPDETPKSTLRRLYNAWMDQAVRR